MIISFKQFLLLENPMETHHYDKELSTTLLGETIPEHAEKIHSIDGTDVYHDRGRAGYSSLFLCKKDTKNPHGKVDLEDVNYRSMLNDSPPKTFKIHDTFSTVPKSNLYGKLFDTMVGEKGHTLISDDLMTPSSVKRWVSHIKEEKYKYTAISPYEKDIPLHAGNIDEILPKIYGKNTNQANFNFKVSPKEKS